MTYYDMHPPRTDAIRARVERGDYSSDALVALRTLLARLEELERQLEQATEGRIDDH